MCGRCRSAARRCSAPCARPMSARRSATALQLVRPESAEAAAAALGNGTKALAGGTDLVPLLRDGIVHAETLVQVAPLLPRGIDGSRIGAGATLAELEVDPQIPDALREACRQAASPQLRAMGTIGGNLLQATRCWYWRLQYPCWLHGGDRCHAKAGAHREHAIFGNDRCASAHPSDIAAALLALGATVHTTKRELPIADLYRLPTDDDRNVTALEPNELILELDVPAPEASVYLKAMDRRKWAFPLVGVAAARMGGAVRIALAGVAPIPWTLPSLDALDGATPLPGTAYKLEIARALVKRALAALDSPGH
ncbi:MAG: xanthine dehydrogenase family protein subunit M [Actinobacteria bacterium]|nr:MAG: xanthine dehydrogenase family protein subunit M [Actinomycetota bacterium]